MSNKQQEPLACVLHLASGAATVPLDLLKKLVLPEDLAAFTALLDKRDLPDESTLIRTVPIGGESFCLRTAALPSYDASQAVAHEKRFRGIVENSPDMFVVLRRDGCIDYVSPRVWEITGYTAHEVLNKGFFAFFIDSQELKLAQTFFEEALNGKNPPSRAYRIRHANGQALWFFVHLSAISDENGKTAEFVAVCRDVTEETKREESLKYMSIHDALTGAFNRFYFDAEMQRIQEEDILDVGLILTDLNGLKLVNDAFGSQRGDELLVEVAKILMEIQTPTHRVFRVGGDEFAILVFNCAPQELTDICETIDEACKRAAGRTIPLSISWGTAFRTSSEQSMQALYKQAEGYMYSKKMLDSRSMRNQVLASLKETLKARNVETAAHMQRMENMVMALGKRLGLSASEFDRLLLLASLHDIGKIAIPDHIINKPERLSDDEWIVMRTHSEVGQRIAMASQELSSIASEIGCHHERWDGKGYPYGYSGGQIPLLARIVSVVDTYDVMTHGRNYKDAVGHQAAVEELRRCAGTQFDPHIVDLFVDIFGSFSQEEMQQFINSEPDTE